MNKSSVHIFIIEMSFYFDVLIHINHDDVQSSCIRYEIYLRFRQLLPLFNKSHPLMETRLIQPKLIASLLITH